MPEAPDRIFVYGTLMPGQPLWLTLKPFTLSWGAATARGRLWDTGHGYPAARFGGEGGEDGEDIPGVLVAVSAAALHAVVAELDRVEDEGTLYRRVEIVTSGGPAIAYEWIGPTERLAPLPAGWPVTGLGAP